ncbi:MAG: hypothetical protein J6P61_06620 [Erysipelotrichaceae bacterium]|nr:hypothetical protein [Erysipelotrichaceae bacterium]
MKKQLVVLFPGIGYTNDKPLLYYSGKLAKQLRYDTIALKYGHFPKNVKGNKDLMNQCFDLALSQTKEQLASVNWDDYDNIYFISKSIGTVTAVSYATSAHLHVKHVLMTPLAQTFYGIIEGIAFHGTADPWADTITIKEMCLSYGIPLTLIDDANHSLETGDVDKDISILHDVINAIKDYIE